MSLQRKVFGRYVPDQNIYMRPIGGCVHDVLGREEFAVTVVFGFAFLGVSALSDYKLSFNLYKRTVKFVGGGGKNVFTYSTIDWLLLVQFKLFKDQKNILKNN
jgi:hypothetical protein